MSASHSSVPLNRLEDLAWLINAEFQEMPGMHLTFAQVQRLWCLPAQECRLVLDYLVSKGLLRQDSQQRFCLPES